MGCDNLLVLKGRTLVQCYDDYMWSFKDNFKDLLGQTIVEIQVGMVLVGELCSRSYLESISTWRFLGIGAFQCYDKYMISNVRSTTEVVGK